ncbi:MAG: hypothetical protein AUJ74_06205 [Candidatus Omnitrophica bacterium CG1_02_44_16]|nr:MAG: hypothetical protein AUJ74_06205 [Candidatus Omnitrophica bacterium CG1_02_44_16]PIY83037.1 MAG: hypothetical protein COY78_03615 [Candidatus Omnitrophica bacterium CG_4_10_14_0_8_um_filter_44_12]PIZ83364.1 MAG: hypothetical protein COX96_08035 [Candidatus Omnitrophica bacterium CG_4_10_14_0_2_um_filter_44_9]
MKNNIIKHTNCIRRALKELSYQYRDKKLFLDVGCGVGTRTIIFDEFNRQICGVDRMDWRDKGIAGKIAFKELDFMRSDLPFESNLFDIAFSFDVIEHLCQPQKMLDEIHRVIKVGGIFIIGTPNRYRMLGLILQLLGLRKFPYYPNDATVNSDPYAAHVREFTATELKKLLNQHGFKIRKTHKLFYGLTGGYGLHKFFNLPLYHNMLIECQK